MCEVQGLSKAVKQVLLPIMKSIKGDFNSVKGELTSLNETVSHLSGDLEQHKNQTTSASEELKEIVRNNAVYTCDGTGGWRRAVYLDMTDPNTNCPEGWNMTDYSKRTCGRPNDGYRTCDSVTFSVSGGEYSLVCGRIRAYQWGWATAFHGSRQGYNTVNDDYFNGVAVMHGSPRQHIWTFANGGAENWHNLDDTGLCPCDGANLVSIPPFVGEDYFCEAGFINPHPNREVLLVNDILWDGMDCHSSSTCCSLHNPPYFTKTLNTPTTNDIELRMCNYNKGSLGHIEVELVELYIK